MIGVSAVLLLNTLLYISLESARFLNVASSSVVSVRSQACQFRMFQSVASFVPGPAPAHLPAAVAGGEGPLRFYSRPGGQHTEKPT